MNLFLTGKIVPYIRPISGGGRFSRNLAKQIQHTAALSSRKAMQVRKIPAPHFRLQVFQYRICCHSHTPFHECTAWPNPPYVLLYENGVEKLGVGKEDHRLSKSGDLLMAVCITVWWVWLCPASHLLVRPVLLRSFCRSRERKRLEAA